MLCVDDHRLMREGVAQIVGVQPDMEVVAEASNGEHAVTQFLASRPDVTLMDLQLPVTSGTEAIRRIRQIDRAARIIVLTMYRGDEDIHRAFEAGAMGYVLKDTISDDLIHVIREVHAGRRVVTPDIQQALDEQARLPTLSMREHQVLELVAEGHAQQGDRRGARHQRRYRRHAREEPLHQAGRARPHGRRGQGDPPRHHPHRVTHPA